MAVSAVIILAAGKGTRMASDLPKPLHSIAGKAMVSHVLSAVASVSPDRTIVVTAPEMEADIVSAIGAAEVILQHPQLGTGHAALQARETLAGFAGDVLVIFADNVLIRPETYQALLQARRAADDPAVVVLGFRPENTAAYARLVLDDAGHLERIVEFKDATSEEREIGLCNSGVMAIDGAVLFDLLGQVGDDNAQGEYYLTDIVMLARQQGRTAAVVEADATELMGVDTRAGLAKAEAVVQGRLRRAAMAAGATLIDPDTVHLCSDTQLGRDTVVAPYVVFGPGVEIGERVEIRSFSHLEGCRIAADAVIGPFARIRPEAEIGPAARIGNFVEVKKARIDEGAKVNHLSYIGDAHVGAGANVGAGTITCNYDGFNKSLTEIGRGAFIGSNSALVAPVKIGDGAIIGAGSVISEEVPADALALTRAELKSVPDYARRYRKRKAAKKAAGRSGPKRGRKS